MISAMAISIPDTGCPHWGVCGGCAVRPTAEGKAAPPPYEIQLREKEALVRGLLAPFDIAEWRPIVPSPTIWYYRNKMEFAFAPERIPPPPPRKKPGEPRVPASELPPVEGVLLGLRQAGHFDRIVDLQRCLLISPEGETLLARVRDWAKRHGITGHDRRIHRGDLRYLVVREGKQTGERMIFLIGHTTLLPKWETARADFEASVKDLATTALIGFTDVRSDVARAPEMQVLWGPGTIQERLGPVTYRLSPFSFFQTNTLATERLYGLLADWARTQTGALIDLYCGSGGITLSLAKVFDRVVGIDTNREAITDATFNAAQNGIQNAEFVCEDALEFLKKLPASKLSIQISSMIVDPPRPGLMPKALQSLLDLNPARLAYVSCNPESLARDLTVLAPLYRIQSAQPVDLFPHTAHVETVVFLEHR
jgi:23S rRNA (uracil1939-C5)-methyltransferase